MTSGARDPRAAFGLEDRVAVVTGASSGLGVQFARALAGAGARVVLAARRAERLEVLAAELGADRARAVACDVTELAQVDALVAATLDAFGRVDVLVNNAGVGEPRPAEEEPIESFRRTLDVNLVGVFQCAQRFGRVMLEARTGSIVNIASIFGLVASGKLPEASYCAAKAGVVNLTRQLAAEWARRGVRVNALAPAYFRSEMTEAMFHDERSMTWLRRHTPLGRPGELHELDGPLLFLASDASSYVTGQTLAVDGGWTAV